MQTKTSKLSFLITIVMLLLLILPSNTLGENKEISYVALGDSLAAGMTPLRDSNGLPQFDKGYPEFIQLLVQTETNVNLRNFAVAGYTSSHILEDIQNDGREFFTFQGVDLPVHTTGLRSHIENANIITLNGGANDLFQYLQVKDGEVNVDFINLQQAIPKVKQNMHDIISEIKTLNPEANIYIMGYYNSFPYIDEQFRNLILSILDNLNESLYQLTETSDSIHFIPTADVIASNHQTYLPNPNDVHLSLLGYEAIANEFMKEILNVSKIAWEIWTEEQKDIAIDKAWTITFNQPIKRETVSSKTLYVLDDKGKQVSTLYKFSDDNKEVTVFPVGIYENGKTYSLHILTGIKDMNGNTLSKNVNMPFTTKEFIEVKTETVEYEEHRITFSLSIDKEQIHAGESVTAIARVKNNSNEEVTYYGVSGCDYGLNLSIPTGSKFFLPGSQLHFEERLECTANVPIYTLDPNEEIVVRDTFYPSLYQWEPLNEPVPTGTYQVTATFKIGSGDSSNIELLPTVSLPIHVRNQ
ncbi:GDSL-type esterase/lipase family protein [Bacillus sp. FJAT-45350]|uniref:GDSL-type esterase/lipase family protein n=1 Tax=Bacillus sp. FJAT-45350 TaxID=2011014 RepID=UPI000BB7D9C6|nr:GDSL-type esterase/lipase family protein [Bacillus sp. FJAT-45350]